MKTLVIVGAIIIASVAKVAEAAEIKVVTEYIYPTAYDVQPIVQNSSNGPIIVGGIVTPKDFQTREVGCLMSVYVEVGRIAGIAAVSDGIKLLNQNTDLMLAASSGDYEAVRLALARGTSVNAQNRFGSTALMGASAGGFDEIVKLLLANKADPNIKSRNGSTALCFAAGNGNLNTVRLLLAHGAEINSRNKEGLTPLMMAVQGGHVEVVKFLLNKGADPTVCDCSGKNAITLAQQLNDRNLVILLMRATDGQ